MYYDVCIHRRGEKVYRRELIRESFRRNGKVCAKPVGTAKAQSTQSTTRWKCIRLKPQGAKDAESTRMEVHLVGTAETPRTQNTTGFVNGWRAT